MGFTPKEPIKIQKSFNFSAKEVTDEGIPYIKIKGYASKMLDSEGRFVIDADNEHIDALGIGLKRLKSGNLPLLFGHDQNKAVGKITGATYKSDGLEIEATVYKLKDDALTNYVYEAVKAGILNSFSVGILVSEFDIIEQDGQDYLQLAKSELIETSIVAVPSNNQATFGILEVKSISDKASEYKTIISKKALKADNPNVCGELETCVLETHKAVDYEDTKKESWHVSDQFRVYLSILTETLSDNFYANRWDELSAQEVTSNMRAAFESFLEDQMATLKGIVKPSEEIDVVDELNAALAADGSFAFSKDEKSLKGNSVQTKDTEVSTPTETPEPEATAVAQPEPQVQPEVVVDTPMVAQEDTSKDPEVQGSSTPNARTADDFVVETALLGANIDKVEVEDLAKYYDAVVALQEIIADHVRTMVQSEVQASA